MHSLGGAKRADQKQAEPENGETALGTLRSVTDAIRKLTAGPLASAALADGGKHAEKTAPSARPIPPYRKA